MHILDAIQLGEDLQVALGAQPLVQAGRLGEDADLRRESAVVLAHVQAVDPGAARRRADQAGQHAHGGRLARAVGAQEAEHLALVHLQVEPIHGLDRMAVTLKVFAKTFSADHRNLVIRDTCA